MAQPLLLTIKNALPNLTESERKIGEYILEHPKEVIQMSASTLAAASGTSPAGVIRFCKSIGVKGFAEFKLLLSAQSTTVDPATLTDFSPNEQISDIKTKMLGNTHYYFEKTNESLKDDLLNAVADWIVEAPIVFVHGIGASYLVASDIKQKFSRVGKHVVALQDAHELVASMSIASEKAVFIAISNSGHTSEGRILMAQANDMGLRTVSLTKDSQNPLNTLAQIALTVADTEEAPLRSGATISLLCHMYAIDLLFYCYMTKQYDQNVTYLNKTRQATESLENRTNDFKK